MTQFRGTGVAVVTPFTEDRQVDLPALERIIEHLILGNTDYLVLLGTTAESATLTPQEKAQVIDNCFQINQGRLPIVLGVGGNHTAAVIEQLQHSTARHRPDAILSVSPYYNKPSQAGIYAHYRAIAESTDLPIMLYNVPGRTASNIQADTTLRLAHACPNIIAIKEASGDLIQCMRIMHDKPEGFLLISGDDALTLPMMSIGAEGVISVLGNAFPRDVHQLVAHALASDYASAGEIHYRYLNHMELAFEEGNPVGIKAMMALQGLCSSQVRLPLVRVSEGLLNRIKKELA